MSTGDRNDPYSAFNFVVELNGVEVGGFAECAGLATETDAVTYRSGGEDVTIGKIPGLKKYTNLSFKRGFTDNAEFWTWRKSVMDGRTERKGGAIVLRDEARKEAMRWTFREGWPSKWEGPSMNAKNSEVAIESLELVVEDLTLEG